MKNTATLTDKDIFTVKLLLDHTDKEIDKCLSLVYLMMNYYDDRDDGEIATRLSIIADMQENIGSELRRCNDLLDECQKKVAPLSGIPHFEFS